MFSVRLYIRVLVYVAAIILFAGLGVAGLASGRAVILGAIAVVVSLVIAARLVYALNAVNRRVRLFLDSITGDSAEFRFPENASGREERLLHREFNRVYERLAAHRAEEFERELARKEYESWEKLMHVLTHEIMNSISPIVSLSGTLQSYFKPGADGAHGPIDDAVIAKTVRALETIRSQGEHLIYFTEAYRQLAFLKRPEPAQFSLREMIDATVTLFADDMAGRGVRFSVSFDRPDVVVFADEKMLMRVLINLLKNSLQALEGLAADGEIGLTVEVDDCRGQLCIRVEDNGPGIPDGLADEIFIPFFTTKQGGSGIGLSLSRQIMRMHGGDLTAGTSHGGRTVFTARLPLEPFRVCC